MNRRDREIEDRRRRGLEDGDHRPDPDRVVVLIRNGEWLPGGRDYTRPPPEEKAPRR